MDEDKEKAAAIMEAHQELVGHIEQGAGRIRALSIITVLVAAVLAASYSFQLLLPLLGTTSVTVSLTDPVNVASELVVLALVLAWLYVGARNLMFSSRMKREIAKARSEERQVEAKVH